MTEMDTDHLNILKDLVGEEKIQDYKNRQKWVERAKKALAITTIDYETYPVVDHTKCSGHYIVDIEGNKYLDMTSGVAVRALGFRYPKQVEFEQKIKHVAREIPGQDFMQIPQILLAEKLIEITPGDFEKRVIFTTSGARANENAIKAAMDMTHRHRFIAFRPAFHGRTGYALSLTASKHVQKDWFPQGIDVIRTDYAYCYRCPFGQTPDKCNVECAQALRDAVEEEANDIAAIFVEPISGEGGMIVPDARWMKELRKIADDLGALLVSDEVQAGMGRTGKWWAIEHFDVVPDIITTAKSIGGGYPLGATIGKAPFYTASGRNSETVSAEPFTALVSLFLINEIEKRNLLKNATDRGHQFLKGLEELKDKFAVIGDVRGIGLMMGIEIVKDKATKERDAQLRNEIVKTAVKEEHLWLLGAGRNSIRLLPPLDITEDETNDVLERLERAIKKTLRK